MDILNTLTAGTFSRAAAQKKTPVKAEEIYEKLKDLVAAIDRQPINHGADLESFVALYNARRVLRSYEKGIGK